MYSWYADAMKDCAKEGGILASIHSKETNDFLGMTLLNYGLAMWQSVYSGAWIGCESRTPNVLSSWRWADNSTFNYSNWDEGNE